MHGERAMQAAWHRYTRNTSCLGEGGSVAFLDLVPVDKLVHEHVHVCWPCVEVVDVVPAHPPRSVNKSNYTTQTKWAGCFILKSMHVDSTSSCRQARPSVQPGLFYLKQGNHFQQLLSVRIEEYRAEEKHAQVSSICFKQASAHRASRCSAPWRTRHHRYSP